MYIVWDGKAAMSFKVFKGSKIACLDYRPPTPPPGTHAAPLPLPIFKEGKLKVWELDDQSWYFKTYHLIFNMIIYWNIVVSFFSLYL